MPAHIAACTLAEYAAKTAESKNDIATHDKKCS
jgi:hypothetical protein